MANVPHAPSGLNKLANARLTPRLAQQFGMSAEGCAWRGSIYCASCEWARYVPIVCEWKCDDCLYRWCCRRGHDGQTVRVDSWFKLGRFAEV